jgi:hypothetical protein
VSYVCNVFGPKRGEVTGGWRKLHKKELIGLYSLRYIVVMNKMRKIRWLGHVERRGEMRNA